MSDLFRLTTIRFRAGAVPGAPPTELPVPYVTVIAGPNNSGKSLLLREIDQWGAGGQEPPVSPWPGAEVVSSIDAIWPSDEEELRRELSDRTVPNQPAGDPDR